MKRRAASIFQYHGKWYGVRFELHGKEVANFEGFAEKSPEELRSLFKEERYGVSLSPSSGYLVRLQFAFSGKRKIGLVIRNELEDLLPFPVDNISLDFQDSGHGNTLVAALPANLLEEWKGEAGAVHVTVNGLAALHMLRWTGIVTRDTFIFVYAEENTATILLFRDGNVQGLRQFYYTPGTTMVEQTLRELGRNGELAGIPCYLIAGSEQESELKSLIALQLRTRVETPTLGKYLKTEEIPSHFWVGMGSALLSLNPGREINLLSKMRKPFMRSTVVTYAAGGFAALCLILLGFSYLNLTLKGRTYQMLAKEQTTVYHAAFPNAPPVKDMEKILESKLQGMGQENPLSTGNGSRVRPLVTLTEISSNLDSQIDVRLNEYVWDEKQFSISGTTTSFGAVEKVKAGLTGIKGIRKVDIENVDMSSAKQVKFKIRGQF
jgi:hypothetical protein